MSEIKLLTEDYGTHTFLANGVNYLVEKDHGAFVGYRIYQEGKFIKLVRARSFRKALEKVLGGLNSDI